MKQLSLFFVILAALFWGVSGGIGGVLINNGWDAYVVSFYRGAIGLLFVLVWLSIQPRNSGLDKSRLWFWSIIAGIGVAGNFTFYFLSISEGSVAVAVTLMYSAPVFVYLTSFLLRIETATPLKWASVFIVMVGIVLLTGLYDTGTSGITLLGVGTGILAGLSYALFIFGFKYASAHGSPQAILAIAFAVLSAVLIWPSEPTQITHVFSKSDWALFVLLGVLGAGLSFIIYIIGLRKTVPSVASVVAMVEPVSASLFGIFILDENFDLLQYIGIASILIAVTALSVQNSSDFFESTSDGI